jgi:5-enolpyruvylshikimate-3-phosphate synthase
MNRPLARATAPLRGGLTVPGDKSISHRVVLLSLLADGPCRATGWLDSADTRSSLEAVRALGAVAHLDGDELTITPPPARPAQDLTIDCGNSGTTARLLMGLLAGWLRAGDGAVTLTGDASLRGRPMGRVVEPLRRMGADLAWAGEQGLLPVVVRGALLRGCEHVLPVASAQVKSALLLAGLGATGVTTVRGADGSRDHTELMLRGLGVPVTGTPEAPAVAGPCSLAAFSATVPGDPSSAAFFQVAAAAVPGSEVTVHGQSLNPTRIGALAVLARAGAGVAFDCGRRRERSRGRRTPRGRVRASGAPLGIHRRRPRSAVARRRDPGAGGAGHTVRRPLRLPRRGRAAREGIRPAVAPGAQPATTGSDHRRDRRRPRDRRPMFAAGRRARCATRARDCRRPSHRDGDGHRIFVY